MPIFGQKMDISKPSVWIPILLSALGLVAAGIVGAYTNFTTVDRHERDYAAMKQEVAGVSYNQQFLAAQAYIRYLQQEIREIEKKYGADPASMPHDVRANYMDFHRQLEDERKRLVDLRKKLGK